MNRFFLLAAFFALSACGTMRARYVRPDIDLPATFPHSDEAARASLDHWWHNFSDPQLDALVDRALKSNNDLAIAALTVRAAQLQAHIAVINPTVSVGYAYEYSRQFSGNVPAAQAHSLSASVSYELDLWDQLSASRNAATWEARASEEDRRSVAIVLVGTAINLYYQLANLNQQITLNDCSIAYAEKTLQIVQVLEAAGGATQLEVSESEQSLASHKASRAELSHERMEVHNALTVLLNGVPWPESSERAAVPDAPPPPVAAGLPASLLHRRPDLRASEARVRESLARMDATRLSFYPTINLTGSVGAASTELVQVVQNPLGTLAATLTLPFVQVNEAKIATAIARTQYEAATLTFRKVLLQALYDVDNALSARTQLAEEGEQLERALNATVTADRLYEIRYRAGSVPLRLWLDAQEARRQAEILLADNRLARLENYVIVCQALGGGADGL